MTVKYFFINITMMKKSFEITIVLHVLSSKCDRKSVK